jgi:DNA-binding SARP family transcriptional activator
MNNRLTVYTLGQLTITLDGQPLANLSSRTAEALLVYLICEKRPLSRQFLADFLWDERTPERAAANLRTLLTMMRKSLGDFLHITRQSVAIDPDSDYWLDALALQEALARLAPILQGQAPLNNENLAALQTAVDLYQGNFLQGFYLSESRGFEEWMLLTQERLQRQVQTAMQQLVSHCLANGLYEAGIAYANRLLALDPFYEKGHRQLMWLLVRTASATPPCSSTSAAARFWPRNWPWNRPRPPRPFTKKFVASTCHPPATCPASPVLLLGATKS